MANVSREHSMRSDLSEVTAKLLNDATARLSIEQEPKLTRGEMTSLLRLADIVTRARTPVERDYQGNPAFAHALEMPTRFAKQLVQLARCRDQDHTVGRADCSLRPFHQADRL